MLEYIIWFLNWFETKVKGRQTTLHLDKVRQIYVQQLYIYNIESLWVSKIQRQFSLSGENL